MDFLIGDKKWFDFMQTRPVRFAAAGCIGGSSHEMETSEETCAQQLSGIIPNVVCNVIFRCEHLVTKATEKTITNFHFLVITYWGKLCNKANIHRKMIFLHNLSELT